MAILSFHAQFVDRIIEGKKRQTIRKLRKYPIKPGQTLQLYTGPYNKNRLKFAEGVCVSVSPIKIFIHRGEIRVTELPSGKTIVYKTIEWLNAFAKKDGFDSWADMKAYWIKDFGVKKEKQKVILRPFVGQLIKWI